MDAAATPHACISAWITLTLAVCICATGRQGGGLDLGEAPSSVVSPQEHVEFLRLFSEQMRERPGDGNAHSQRQAEVRLQPLPSSLSCTSVFLAVTR